MKIQKRKYLSYYSNYTLIHLHNFIFPKYHDYIFYLNILHSCSLFLSCDTPIFILLFSLHSIFLSHLLAYLFFRLMSSSDQYKSSLGSSQLYNWNFLWYFCRAMYCNPNTKGYPIVGSESLSAEHGQHKRVPHWANLPK